MDYQKKLNTFINYFKNAESKKENHKIGVEFEHLILNQDLSAVHFKGEKGIEALLKALSRGDDWEEIYEKEHLVCLKSKNKIITLEPGGQLELSIIPYSNLKEIKAIYFDFLEEISAILDNWNQIIASVGYQPESKIEEIPILPKNRYAFMYKYFKKRGKYAHNMMKGTASVQMSIDYLNQEDYIKKMRASYFLTPLIYYLFDNTPFFEGEKAANSSIRADIWENCDSDRSGLIKGIFEKEFSYADYADYLLQTPAIIAKKEGKLIYSGEKTTAELMENDKIEEIEHFISMVFPDIRTKKYIEIRAADALPYPYNFSFIALMKNLLYDKENLNYLYQKSLNYNQEEFIAFKNEIIKDKENEKRDILIAELIKMAKAKASKSEIEYLNHLEEIFNKHGRIKFKTLANLDKGKKEALKWCFLN